MLAVNYFAVMGYYR